VELGATTCGWRLANVGLGAASLGGLGWGFYRREREDGVLGTSYWGSHDQGPKLGVRLPRCHQRGSPWRQQRSRQENVAAWRVPEGESGILWANGGSPGCWRAHMARRPLLRRGTTACWRWDRAEGGERREKVRDLSAKSKNSRGRGEKGAKNHSSQGQIKNI
jgi:hypothetical protein